MIENTQPLKIAYQFTTPGYTKVYYLHSSFSDLDVSGKAIWVDSVLQPLDTDLSKLYFFTTGHTPGSTISTEAAYYDAMVDATLLANRSGVSISDPTSVTLRQHPSISSYQVVADNVDIGVSPPVLLINLTGYADQIEVQWAPTGTTDWTTVFLGGFGSQISVPNIPIGTVDVRVQGRVIFPDGDTVEISDWQVESGIVLNWAYEPPEAPSNITFTTALLAEPSERYDVKVDWDWDIGAGSNAREFVVWSIPQSLYSSNPIGSKWSGAELVNSGTAKSVVITNHPFDREIRYRVAAISWGPEGDSTTFSSETTFTITDTTPIDSDFTTQTGIELTYSHIKGLLNDGGTWKQTFLVNAADGAVAIGLLDGNGEAPISFDPTNGIVNVKGSVISEEIIAASFVLANFTGQDNPRLYSTGKPAYGDPTKGIFMGFDNADFKYKFDLGDSTKYIRWDGDKMVISGEVVITTPGGEVPIGEGGVLVVPIYKNDTSTPPTPTDTNYPPSGWGVSPPPRSAGQNTYISSGTIDQATNALVSGESWSAPSLHSGDKGDNGSDGKSTYLASIYKRSATAPGTPTGGSYNFGTNTLTPPSGWSVSVPTGSDPLYTSSALASIQGTTGTDSTLSWKAPTIMAKDGVNGVDGDDATSVAQLQVYKRSSNAPGTPSGGSFNFGTGVLTPPSGWSTTTPSGTDPVYSSNAIASVVGTTGIDNSLVWSTGSKLVQDGTNGSTGKSTYQAPIYRRDASAPSSPSGGSYNFGTNTLTPPSNWFVTIPADNGQPLWSCTQQFSIVGDTGTATGGQWSAVSKVAQNGTDGSDGKSTYLAPIYKRSSTVPGAPTGGSYNFGTNTLTPPSGWSVSVPSGTDPVYTSSALASIVGTTGIDASLSWSAPTILSQNGQDGSDGDRGAGFFAQAIAGFNGSFNTTSANNFFTSNFGKPRVLYDVLTQYNTSDPTIATTRMWNGSSWTTAALVVHGDMIVDGTIRAEKIVASSGIINELGAEVIYDKAAFDGGSPESNYKMKIDLVNGSIHIR